MFDGQFSWYVVPQHNLAVTDAQPFSALAATPEQTGNIVVIDDANGSFEDIFGTGQSDYIIGTPYGETLFGGTGNDTLFGGSGNDRLVGAPIGLVGSAGDFDQDLLVGGVGADTYSLSDENGSFYIRGVPEWETYGERLIGSPKDYAIIPFYFPEEGDVLSLAPQYTYYRMPVDNQFFLDLGYSGFDVNAVSIEIVADIDSSGDINTGDQTVAIIGANENPSAFDYGIFTI